MTSTDEVYGSIMCDGALTCYGAIAWRNRAWQRAAWQAGAVRAR